jgi:hypothetical protein
VTAKSISRPRPIAGICSLCNADAGPLRPGFRCPECAPLVPEPKVCWMPREVRPLLTPWWERWQACVLLGLLLGYGLGLLILGVWWRAVQEANAW